jgi:hypothetical protein
MKRFVIIVRGPVEGISGKNCLLSEEDLVVIRTWLKELKSKYSDMLFQKFTGPQTYFSKSGKIENKIIQQIDGGEISQIITLILPSIEVATAIAMSFPFPNSFYTIELREMS